jgi:hypothetical protein
VSLGEHKIIQFSLVKIGMGGYEKAYTCFKEFSTWNCHPKEELMKTKAIPPKPCL